MGACDSKPVPKKKKTSGPKKELTFGRDPNLNMADFMMSNVDNENLLKTDNKGQQFLLEDCKSCNVAILDVVAALTADYLTDCTVVTGPIESSAFIRNCKGCTFVIAACQFRTRECSDCTFFLYSSTEPIIETSKNLTIGCYEYGYHALAAQFEKSKLSVWNNKWSEVYDFTPSPGAGNKTSANWKAMNMSGTSHMDYVKSLSEIDAEGASAVVPAPCAVPLTYGGQYASSVLPGQTSVICIFTPAADPASVLKCYSSWTPSGALVLVRSRLLALTGEQASEVFKSDRGAKATLKACVGKGNVLALEFSYGDTAGNESIITLLESFKGQFSSAFWSVEGDAAEACGKYLFSFIKEEQ